MDKKNLHKQRQNLFNQYKAVVESEKKKGHLTTITKSKKNTNASDICVNIP